MLTQTRLDCSPVTTHRLRKLQALQWSDPSKLFEDFDEHANGFVTMNELREGLRRHGVPVELAELIIKDFDCDVDGQISSTEWSRHFYRSRLVVNAQPVGETFTDLTYGKVGCEIWDAELRGISVAQLEDLGTHVRRRCEKEGWVSISDVKLSGESVSHYETARYVTRPATIERKCSYVELVACAPQPPTWYVSAHLMQCTSRSAPHAVHLTLPTSRSAPHAAHLTLCTTT